MSIKGVLPYQRLTTEEKIAEFGSVFEWGKCVVDAMDGIGNSGFLNTTANKYTTQINLDLANGKLNTVDFEYIIKEFRISEKQLPKKLKNYPLIPNIIQELVGEKIARPFNYRVIQTNYNANSVYDEAKKQKTVEMAKNQLLQQMVEMGLTTEDQIKQDPDSVHTPEDVENYMQYSWKDIREMTAQDSLNYLTQKLRIKYLFRRNFKNFLALGRAVFYVGTYHNEPNLRIVSPQFFEWDLSTWEERIEKSGWVKEEEFLTASEVHDRYYDSLTDDDVKMIETIKGKTYINGTNFTQNTSVPVYYDSGVDNNIYNNSLNYGGNTFVRVVHLEWASLRLIGSVVGVDENGVKYDKIVDEDYKKQKNEEIEWSWINEYWEGTKIGDSIYINVRPIANQKRDQDNLSECYSNYVGIKYDYCLVDLLKSYQYLYNVIMFYFEQAIALAKGKALLFDIAQIPTTQGFDLEKWIYYLQTSKIAFLDSSKETQRGERASANFNQFQVLDMELGNSIQYYVNILNKIEDAAQNLVGVTRQRLAGMNSSDGLGTTQTAIQQSSYITEHIFDAYEDFERRTLEALLETSKSCWIKGKKTTYILDSGEKSFLDVDGNEYNNGTYSVFVNGAAKDKKIMQFIEQNAQAAISAGKNTISEIAKILEKDNVTFALKSLEADEKAREQQQQQAQESQQQHEAELAKQEQDLAKYKIDTEHIIATEKNIADLQKAAMSMGLGEEDKNDDGIADQYSLLKLAIDQSKLDLQKLKQKNEQSNKEREFALKKEDLSIKRIKANKPTTTKR